MNRFIFLLLLFNMTIIACKKEKIPSNRLELFKLGIPEQPDTNDLTKKGAERYFCFDQNSDSVFIKFYDAINPKTGEINSPIPFINQYYWKQLNQDEKYNLNNSINYLLKLTERKIPKNKINPDRAPMSSFGVWLAVITDSINIKHYYTFIGHNLPSPLRNLCAEMDLQTYQDKLANPINPSIKINTDSLVNYYIEKFLKAELLEIVPPPSKIKLMFAPRSNMDDE